jgi:hypothetical protein
MFAKRSYGFLLLLLTFSARPTAYGADLAPHSHFVCGSFCFIFA